MHLHVDLSDGRLLPAVLLLVCLLALVLGLTVRFNKSDSLQSRQHYSEGFDRGSFLDLGLVALILLPFVIVYLI
jgi:hypothetical protein